ncbi:MAG TPA: thioredoxin family protein [Phycisphaerales bacterium]|nr:thioredoxin family protein [Phycisphaerales bacterium]
MAAVNSTMVPLGTGAPDFTLTDTVSGKPINLASYRAGKPVLVMFICNHCPFVVHVRSELAKAAAEFQKSGVAVVAISSNDPENYPDDAPAKMTVEAKRAGYTFAYLFDADQSVAKAYKAACTPDFFLYDAAGKLYYRGQFDASRPGNSKPVTGEDLRSAVSAMLAGKPAPVEQWPSIGCNIKWKPGNAPDYF